MVGSSTRKAIGLDRQWVRGKKFEGSKQVWVFMSGRDNARSLSIQIVGNAETLVAATGKTVGGSGPGHIHSSCARDSPSLSPVQPGPTVTLSATTVRISREIK